MRKEILVRLPRPLAAQIERNVPASNTAGTLWERQCAHTENKEKQNLENLLEKNDKQQEKIDRLKYLITNIETLSNEFESKKQFINKAHEKISSLEELGKSLLKSKSKIIRLQKIIKDIHTSQEQIKCLKNQLKERQDQLALLNHGICPICGNTTKKKKQ